MLNNYILNHLTICGAIYIKNSNFYSVKVSLGILHGMTNLNQLPQNFCFSLANFLFPFSRTTVLDSPLRHPPHPICFTETPLHIPFLDPVFLGNSFPYFCLSCLRSFTHFFSSAFNYTPFMPLSSVFSCFSVSQAFFSFPHVHFPFSIRGFRVLLCLEHSLYFPLKQKLQVIYIGFSKYIFPFIRNH